MTELDIEIKLAGGADVAGVQEALARELARAKAVQESEVTVEEPRLGVDIATAVTAINATILLVRTLSNAAEEAQKLAAALRALAQGAAGLKEAWLRVRGRKVPLADVTAEDILQGMS